MKKNIYLIITLICSFMFISSVSAKVEFTYNVEYSAESFNIFYEFEQGTSLASYLAEHGTGKQFIGYLMSYANDYYNNYMFKDDSNRDFKSYDYYAAWVDYCGSYKNDYADCYYRIDLTLGLASGNNFYYQEHYLLFDSEMNFIHIGRKNSWFSQNSNITINFFSHPEYYFRYYTGNLEYYDESETFIFKAIKSSDNKLYYINVDSLGSKVEEYAALVFRYWTQGLNSNRTNATFMTQFDFSYYETNAIIGKEIKLATISHAILGNEEDAIYIDLTKYSKINVSDYPDGVWLYPKSTSASFETFLGYTSNLNQYINGSIAILHDNGTIDTDIKNVFRSNFERPYAVIKFNYGAFSDKDDLVWTDPLNNWYKYAYYFYTDNNVNDAYIFYDKSSFDQVTTFNNGKANLYNALSDTWVVVDSSNIKEQSNEKLSDSHYVYQGNKDVSGNYVANYGNGFEVIDEPGSLTWKNILNSDIASSTKNSNIVSGATDVISETRNGISVMTNFFSEIFNGFPLMKTLIIFLFSSLIIIAILKAFL